MRNNIKRCSVAVLVVCGLAVSVALAESSSQAELGVTQKDFYVAENGGNVVPYDTPENAARDINTVLALAEDGAVIHVAAGWYRPADGLMITNGVTIVADEGPDQTFLFAPMTTANKAMVTIAHADAVLSGLTVTGKDENENQPEQWGGLHVTAGVVTNCVISHHKTKGKLGG